MLAREVILLIGTVAACAQTPTTRATRSEHSPRELRADLDVAVRALEEAHPALHAHLSGAELARVVASIAGQLDHAMTSAQMYRALGPLVAAVHCYHTWLWPASDDDLEVLPLDVIVRPEGVFVRRDLANQLAPGTRLVAIDGVPIDASVSALVASYPIGLDGLGTGPRYRKLSRPGYFARAYALAIQARPPTRVTVMKPGGAVEVPITPISAKALATALVEHRSHKLELPGDGRTAIVRIPSLGDDPAFAPFLATTFATLKARHVQRLVLDLRADQGGEDLNGVLVYAYLSAVPFRYYAHLVANHEQFTSSRGDASFPADRFRARLVPTADGRFEVRPDAHPGLQLQEPQADHFDGAVVILVDGLTGSAASELAAVAHANRRARFVGEETGGGYAMDTSGPQIDLVLPNTKLRITIPTVQYQLAVPDAFPHRGLVPDVLVAPTVEDLLAARDPQLARALALLEESDPR